MTNYKLNEEKMFADVADGVAIIINSETGIYYGLNGFATNVYENIVNGASIEKILAALKQIPNITDGIEENFNTFIEQMLKYELLIAATDSDAEVSISEDVAKESDYILVFSEYNDAQELLLADPIHEVKEETGWTPEKDSIGYTKEETAEREKRIEEDK